MTVESQQTPDGQQTRYADVLERLQRALVAGRPDPSGTGQLPGLPQLRSRTSEDLTLALVDAWAVLAEILGFHSARHGEEAGLDTATELRSLIELSRLVGYRPDPGLAASASLAFTIDAAVPLATVPTGTAVTSVPGPGETALTYETVETISARSAWNVLLPRRSAPQFFTAPAAGTGLSSAVVLLAGTTTNVGPGDGILVAAGPAHVFGIVSAVHVRPDDPAVPGTGAQPGWTRLTVTVLPAEASRPSGDPSPGVPLAPVVPPPGPLLRALSPGGATTLDSDELDAAAITGGFATADVFAALVAGRASTGSALVFRAQAGIFGGSAPDRNSLPPTTLAQLASSSGSHAGVFLDTTTPIWADSNLASFPGAGGVAGSTHVFCDAVVRAAAPGPIVLRDGSTWRLVSATSVDIRALSVFTVSGRSTALTVASGDLSPFIIRRTSVFLAGELIPLAAAPDVDGLPSEDAFDTIELDDWADGLESGQRIAITGLSATHPGLRVAHVSTLRKVRHLLSATGSTSLILDDPLPDTLLRASVRINANVAGATHGESRSEVLGSGTGQDPSPSFSLSGSPLTYLPTAAGSAPALTVYVNGLARPRVEALLDPAEPGYVVRQDDRQISTIQFSSPLPTGVINVRADYRVGLGAGARVRAGQLSMLSSRPPAVRGVVNPLDASGGADPETVDDARRNAPISVRALDRVVSLIDYADFARAYSGIAKAAARAVTIGDRPGVEVTVAGANGGEITSDSDLSRGLLAAFAAAGDALVPVRLLPSQRVAVRVGVALRVDPARIAADVLQAARIALSAALSFEARDLNQAVSASEIVDALQSVPGVISANVRVLCRLVGGVPEDATTYRPILRADPVAGSLSTAAVLLTLDVASLQLEVVAP